MMYRAATIVLALLLAAPLDPSRAAQTVPAVAAPADRFDADVRREIIAKFSEALGERYIFPDIAKRVVEKINTALAAGEYDEFGDPVAFTQRLSTDVEAIARDKHLSIWSTNAAPPPPSDPGVMPSGEAGISRADKLAGGIGYIEVFAFPPTHSFKPVLDKAMTGLKGSRALIIDIRRNSGGWPEGVAYLVSFLLASDRPIPIDDIVSRVPKTNEFTRKSFSSVPTPVSFDGVPVYVLTSKGTFSGGEAFAYDVQALKRGTVIGEVTGGGANPTRFIDLGHGIGATIPFGRAENAVTKTNWEGRGVQPDVSVPAGDALKVALEKLGHEPVSGIGLASTERTFTPRSTPHPQSEPALRRLISGLMRGEPDYAAMTPEAADMMRQQLSHLQAQFSALGELQSTNFIGPDMIGGDEFEIAFANGSRIMALVVDPSGKIAAVSSVRMAPENK